MDTLLQDLRLAARHLSRRPLTSLVAIATLATGIGANTAMFSFVRMMLFAPAPGTDPDQLVWLSASQGPTHREHELTGEEYRALREWRGPFADMAAYESVRLGMSGHPVEGVYTHAVSGNFFEVLGIHAGLGRTFHEDEDVAGAHPVVVLSDRFWRRHFAVNARVLDSTLVLNGRPYAIIGVARPEFRGLQFGDAPSIWIPLALLDTLPASVHRLHEETGHLSLFARLRPGGTVAQANTAVRTLAPRLARTTARDSAVGLAVSPLIGAVLPTERGTVLPLLRLFLVVPALVLLVACANVGNLRLARSVTRRREFAVRRALGATRARLARLLLTESLVLSMLAAAAGVVVAFWLTSIIVQVAALPPELATALRPDARVLAATAGLAILAGIFVGLAPALSAAQPSLTPALKDADLTLRLAGRHHRVRDAFVVAQIAVSLVLIVVAGLFLRSSRNALRTNPGFDARDALALNFDLAQRGTTPAARHAFAEELLARARGLPGVTAAARASWVPLTNGMPTGAAGAAESNRAQEVSVGHATVSSQYFAAMRIPLVRGRGFSEEDRGAAVAVVNETLARRLWRSANPLGRALRVSGAREPVRIIVGVARDGKYDSPVETPRGFIYLPELVGSVPAEFTLIVRSATDGSRLAAPLTVLVRALDPDLRVNVIPLAELVRFRVEKQRSLTSMLGVFGAIALLVASLGIFGVTAHAVGVRTKEIGVRIALGARPREVVSVFVLDSLGLCLPGVAIGLGICVAAARVLSGALYGLGPVDPISFGTGAACLCGVAALASYLPARRAARVDPMVALRTE